MKKLGFRVWDKHEKRICSAIDDDWYHIYTRQHLQQTKSFSPKLRMSATKALKTFSKIERIANDMWLTSLSAQCAMTEKNREKMMDKIMKLNEKIRDVTSANWH